ncbi:MAG: imidazole glycerol phosphate synthase subunit HisH [Pseudopedobacter saltans]|uniref:Imidazole glycerol phosphate synthase subunit HisH n=1 Tax=Pseudopedobacter saltans TaxID=151895 RepID=A0A2W5EKQ6_9SPHI|nr:MAG: imidazole glycerol phosphate synthase subunit HisH [Pseudopedobacter saltans]
MRLAIVKYNAGNIQSVLYALERIGANAEVTDNPELLQSADKVIFPGVGEASSSMKYLKERNLDKVISSLKQPVLGICFGMQLMCAHSEEGNVDCLGIFDEQVKRFPLIGGVKVPQIGWNQIQNLQTPLFEGVSEDSFCYFVHSFYASVGPHTIGTTEYGIQYSSALHKDNFWGVQYHPEKSATIGERILKNFIEKI